MPFNADLPEDVILRMLGERVAAARLDLNLTQAELAEQAGISKRSIERLESGKIGTQLSGFLRVCKALGLIDRFETLLPTPTISPITLLKLRGSKRQRATGSKSSRAPKWTWGETT